MTAKAIVHHFYTSLEHKNDEWQTDVASDIVFSDASKALHAEGKEAFVQSFTQFLKAVKRIHLKQVIVEGNNACAIVSYDYLSPKGTELHQDDAEVLQVADGKIDALTIYFDITEFRAFMSR